MAEARCFSCNAESAYLNSSVDLIPKQRSLVGGWIEAIRVLVGAKK
jgi:hypothetical protein